MELPVDNSDIALFNASTSVVLGNEKRLSSGHLAGYMVKHLQHYTRPCSDIARGKTEQSVMLWMMITGSEMSTIA